MNNVTFFGQKYGLLSTRTVLPFLLYVLKRIPIYTAFFLIIIVSICIRLLTPSRSALAENSLYPNELIPINATLINVVWPDVVAVQSDYKTSNGKYWQGLRSHADIPVAGTPTVTNMNSHPSDQAHSWSDVGFILNPLDVAIQVDVYESPLGQGYTLTGIVEVDGEIWQKVINSGPEIWLEHDWTMIEIEQ